MMMMLESSFFNEEIFRERKSNLACIGNYSSMFISEKMLLRHAFILENFERWEEGGTKNT